MGSVLGDKKQLTEYSLYYTGNQVLRLSTGCTIYTGPEIAFEKSRIFMCEDIFLSHSPVQRNHRVDGGGVTLWWRV